MALGSFFFQVCMIRDIDCMLKLEGKKHKMTLRLSFSKRKTDNVKNKIQIT